MSIKTQVVRASEMFDDNPSLCLSSHRGLNQCHLCPKLKRYLYSAQWSGGNANRQLRCNPKMNEKALELLELRAELVAQFTAAKKRLQDNWKELEQV